MVATSAVSPGISISSTLGMMAGIGGLLFTRVNHSGQRMSSRDGYFIVAAAWIIVSLLGALPLYLDGVFPTYINPAASPS